MDVTDRLADRLADLDGQRVELSRSTVTGVSPLTVDGADGDLQLDALGWYMPAIGDVVWLLRGAQRAVILGAATPNDNLRPPLTGTVQSVQTTTATVTAGGQTYAGLPFVSPYQPAAGDAVLLVWQETAPGTFAGMILGKSGAVAAKVTAAPAARDTPDAPQQAADRKSVV